MIKLVFIAFILIFLCSFIARIKKFLKANSWLKKAFKLYRLGLYDEALKSCDKAIEIRPDFVEAWNDKGLILGILGKYKEALKAYDKAIEIKPDYAEPLASKKFALRMLSKFDEALKAYEKEKQIAFEKSSRCGGFIACVINCQQKIIGSL